MKYFLPIFMSILLAFQSTSLLAEEVDRAVIEYNGTEGFFFKKEIADRMLEDLSTRKDLEAKVALYEYKLTLKDEAVRLREAHIKLEEEIGDRWRDVANKEREDRLASDAAYEKRLKERMAWYREPVLWLLIGLIVGAGTSIGIVFGVQEAK